MALRLALAFCTAAAFAAALTPSLAARRLDSRSRSDQWIHRANAALLLADTPGAIPRLIALGSDPAPPVRANARWTLGRLTGWPWESEFQACASRWPAPTAAFPRDPETSAVTFTLRDAGNGTIEAVLSNGGPVAVELRRRDSDAAAIALFGPGARVARLLRPEGSRSGAVTLRIHTAGGRCLQVSWISVHGAHLPAGGSWTGDASLSGLPRGVYRVDAVLGDTSADTPAADGRPAARARL
ncbi:MAG: hypothetical protein HUU15_12040, partial [Candidatus Brocadiae bacterium]|nr:hypothetical protein [Candidatus Brocadiia bacterium]